MSEPKLTKTEDRATGRRLPWKLLLTTLGVVAVGFAIWKSFGTKAWREIEEYRKELRAVEDNTPVGYIGLNYRPTYASRPNQFVFEEEGRKKLWVAMGPEGKPPHVFLDVTEADPALRLDLISGGYGIDSIPGIDYPIKEDSESPRGKNLQSRTQVYGMLLEQGPIVYPRELLLKIEMINDVDGAKPILVVFDRGSNRALIFDRKIEGETVTFGTTGYSQDKVPLLYDRATRGLWLVSGESLRCVNGPFKGKSLDLLRTLEAGDWGDWLGEHPQTLIVVGNDRSRPIPER